VRVFPITLSLFKVTEFPTLVASPPNEGIVVQVLLVSADEAVPKKLPAVTEEKLGVAVVPTD
jgi:hypothetical protein